MFYRCGWVISLVDVLSCFISPFFVLFVSISLFIMKMYFSHILQISPNWAEQMTENSNGGPWTRPSHKTLYFCLRLLFLLDSAATFILLTHTIAHWTWWTKSTRPLVPFPNFFGLFPLIGLGRLLSKNCILCPHRLLVAWQWMTELNSFIFVSQFSLEKGSLFQSGP